MAREQMEDLTVIPDFGPPARVHVGRRRQNSEVLERSPSMRPKSMASPAGSEQPALSPVQVGAFVHLCLLFRFAKWRYRVLVFNCLTVHSN